MGRLNYRTNTMSWDITFCNSDCDTFCGRCLRTRRLKDAPIPYISVADFSSMCEGYRNGGERFGI